MGKSLFPYTHSSSTLTYFPRMSHIPPSCVPLQPSDVTMRTLLRPLATSRHYNTIFISNYKTHHKIQSRCIPSKIKKKGGGGLHNSGLRRKNNNITLFKLISDNKIIRKKIYSVYFNHCKFASP